MKRKSVLPARRLEPILQELYAVKAALNREAKFDVNILCEQVRKEARQRSGKRAGAG